MSDNIVEFGKKIAPDLAIPETLTEPDKECIDALEFMLAEARTGHIRGFIGVALRDDGAFTTISQGTETRGVASTCPR